MPNVDAYGIALISVVLCALLAQVFNALTGIRKSTKGLAPGQRHEADFSDPSYRLDRTYMNSVETIGFFIALVFAAILAGANPILVNIFAALVLLMRIGQNVVFLRGIGKPYNGIRTRMATVSAFGNFGLALTTIWAVLT